MIRSGIVAFALALVMCGPVGTTDSIDEPTIELSRGGRSRYRVVLAADASAPEKTAAEELATYLRRVTGARWPLVVEGDGDPVSPAIYVGPTARSAAVGLDAGRLGRLGEEEWILRTVGNDVILAGGRPRGTLYAVYRFVEEHVGVRWWSPWDEYVPHRPTLAIPALDERGAPAFAYRDVQGLNTGPVEFHARNRHAGHHSYLSGAYGGRHEYGPPSLVHNFFLYVPPDEYFETHPEFFALIDGERRVRKAQLCLTNDALVELVTRKLRGYVEQSRASSAKTGEPPPRIFEISQQDWAGPCECAACRRAFDETGSHAGALVRFVNRIAENIREDYPDVLLGTLAYEHTLAPPRGVRLADNVALRVSGLYVRDFLKPVSHRSHRRFQEALAGWQTKTSHLRVWTYGVTFGWRPNNFPLPNLDVLADDFRYFRDHGVEGIYIQMSHPVLGDMIDLKRWLVLKLLEDPDREVDALVRDFTDGYYGAAGQTIRDYLDSVERAARRRVSAIVHPNDPDQFRYVDRAFVRQAHALFDRAEGEVRSDPVRRARVRHARVSLDRATLHRWKPSFEYGAADEPRLDPRAIAARLLATAGGEIDRRVPVKLRKERRRSLSEEIDKALQRADR